MGLFVVLHGVDGDGVRFGALGAVVGATTGTTVDSTMSLNMYEQLGTRCVGQATSILFGFTTKLLIEFEAGWAFTAFGGIIDGTLRTRYNCSRVLAADRK